MSCVGMLGSNRVVYCSLRVLYSVASLLGMHRGVVPTLCPNDLVEPFYVFRLVMLWFAGGIYLIADFGLASAMPER